MTGQSKGRWPEGRRAAVSITMDNMGEAADLLRGMWSPDETIGRHHSVTTALPEMLKVLERFEVRCTYFIEAWNVGTYPGAINAVRRSGHEIAFHGWQHEPWSHLEPEEERDLFSRGVSAFGTLNLSLAGFRPPGGVLTQYTPRLLREFGFTYCSPAGERAAADDQTVYLPFAWQGIDAYYYSDGFSGLREAKGDPSSPLEPGQFVERVEDLLEHRVSTGGYTALLFHPFLESEQPRIDAVCQILQRVTEDDRIWSAPGHEIATWVREHAEEFGEDPGFDNTSWSR